MFIYTFKFRYMTELKNRLFVTITVGWVGHELWDKLSLLTLSQLRGEVGVESQYLTKFLVPKIRLK